MIFYMRVKFLNKIEKLLVLSLRNEYKVFIIWYVEYGE